jgi:hypothetical protein
MSDSSSRGGGDAAAVLSRADEGASRMRIAPGHIIVSLGRAGKRPLAGPTDGISGILRFVCFQQPTLFPAPARSLSRSLAAAALFLARTRPLPLVGVYNEMGGWLVGRLPLRSFRDEVCCGNCWLAARFLVSSIFH